MLNTPYETIRTWVYSTRACGNSYGRHPVLSDLTECLQDRHDVCLPIHALDFNRVQCLLHHAGSLVHQPVSSLWYGACTKSRNTCIKAPERQEHAILLWIGNPTSRCCTHHRMLPRDTPRSRRPAFPCLSAVPVRLNH